MITRDQFVAEARRWMGTPWQHQGRLHGVGVDCAGLILESARTLGLANWHYDNYPRRPDGTLRSVCDQVMDPMPMYEATAADVLLFAWNNSPVHLAILTSKDTIIHAYAINRRVVEHRIDDRWREAVAAAYHIRGIE
jgi:NlpC/P60 family putative phage cell wall peptidase